MLNGNDVLILAARLLITTLFLIFGWRKLRDYSGTVSQMVQLGVPMPVLAAGVATFMRTAHTVNTLHLPMLLLHWAVVFGDLDLAFLICNRTLDQFELQGAIPVPDFLSQLWLPELRAFRQDPRFQVFATRLGLMEYWQQYGSPDEFDVKDGKLTYHELLPEPDRKRALDASTAIERGQNGPFEVGAYAQRRSPEADR